MATLPNYKRSDVVYLGQAPGSSRYHRRLMAIDIHEFFRHMWIKGQPGSGKTAELASFADQTIDIGGIRRNLTNWVFDPKGDNSLFWSVCEAAKRNNLPMKVISTQPGMMTHAFNPLRQKALQGLSPVYLAEYVGESTALRYGMGYGEGHFSAWNDRVLRWAWEQEPRDFAEAATIIVGSRKFDAGNVAHALNTMLKLACFNFLNTSDPELLKHQVDVEDTFFEPQVIYVWAPASMLPEGVFSIIRFIFQLLRIAASKYPAGTRNGHIIYADELGSFISPQFTTFLDQGRSFHLGCVIAHQHDGQLQIGKRDYTQSVASSTNLHLNFSPHGSPKQYEEYGRRIIDYRPGFTSVDAFTELLPDGSEMPTGSIDYGVSLNPFERPVFDHNARRDISARENWFTLDAIQDTKPFGLGGTQTECMFQFHVDPKTYELRSQVPPPSVQAPFLERGMFLSACGPAQTAIPAPTKPPSGTPALPAPTPSSDDVWPKIQKAAAELIRQAV